MPIFQVTDPKTGRVVELETQDNTPPTEQELEQVFSSSSEVSSQVTSKNKFLSDTPIPEEKSAVSIPTRAWLSFHNKLDQEKILKKDFSIVNPLPDGNFLVGNDPRDLQPVTPDGLMNDLLGKFADHAADIPVIAGQLIALGLAPQAAIPARMAMSGLGAGAGQAVSSTIGQKKIDEIATDVAATAVFGAAAEGLVQGAVTGAKVLAPKLSGMLNKINSKSAVENGISPESTPFANTTSKVFRYLANVPEASTQTFFKYGMKEMNNPYWFKPESVKGIVKETVESLESTSKQLGEDVAKQTDMLVNIARNRGKDTRIPTKDLFLELKRHATDLGILDDFGRVNKRYPNPADIKPMTNLLNELGHYKDGKYIADVNKSIPIKKALQISRSFGDKYDGVSPKIQASFYSVLNGTERMPGIRPRISKMADELGVEGYREASKKYAAFSKILDDMRALDSTAPSKIETFVSRLETIGQIEKENLVALDKMTNKGLLKKWELWNAAQDFNKTDLNVLRFGSIASILGGLTGTGFNPLESKPAALGATALLGTPQGLRLIIRVANKSGAAISKEKLKEIGMQTGAKIDKKVASTILTQLIKNKSESLNQKNNSDNNNKENRKF